VYNKGYNILKEELTTSIKDIEIYRDLIFIVVAYKDSIITY